MHRLRCSGIFDFFSATTERNSTELGDRKLRNITTFDRKQDLSALYQFYVFRADRKTNKAAIASDWLRYFSLLCNRWTEFNESKFKYPLSSLCFSGWIGKPRSTPLPLISRDIFDSIFSVTAEQYSSKLDRKQDLNVLYQVCVVVVFFFLPIWNPRSSPLSLIALYNFDFISATAERNSTKLDREQDLNILQFVFFGPIIYQHLFNSKLNSGAR